MANTLQPYLDAVCRTLEASLCLSNFGSQVVERHNKPEVEARSSPELLLRPMKICRSAKERVLIETSINSVRVSIKLKQMDELDDLLISRFSNFLMRRAEDFIILRRKPVKGYDISFLITNQHTDMMLKAKLVDFVKQFMEMIDREISALKISVNARGRMAACEFLKNLAF
eukprot:gnl/Trimastix_PCT/677.p1 GENE.gnl/Trimastix_PCT/677~~gnl/Trimastix_PCT/677.p1  ORF type:complete len:182 (-),score=43.98 gnl/Trimastix_PCT/677:120-632(-)